MEFVNGELAGMFKKVMSVPDELIGRYYELLSRISVEEFSSLKEKLKNGEMDPRDAKKELAVELVTRYHGPEEAGKALKEYEKLQTKEVPDDIPEMEVAVGDETDDEAKKRITWLPHIMKETGLAKSTSEAIRLIKQSGVKINDSVAFDPEMKLSPGEHIIKVGKRRFYRVIIK